MLHAAFSRARAGGVAPEPQLHAWLTAVHSFIVVFVEQRAMPPAQKAGLLLKAASCIELFSVHLIDLLLAASCACRDAGLHAEAQRFAATLAALHSEASVLSPVQVRQLRGVRSPRSAAGGGSAPSPSVLRRRTPQQQSVDKRPRGWKR